MNSISEYMLPCWFELCFNLTALLEWSKLFYLGSVCHLVISAVVAIKACSQSEMLLHTIMHTCCKYVQIHPNVFKQDMVMHGERVRSFSCHIYIEPSKSMELTNSCVGVGNWVGMAIFLTTLQQLHWEGVPRTIYLHQWFLIQLGIKIRKYILFA